MPNAARPAVPDSCWRSTADHFSVIGELQKPDGAPVKAALDLLSHS
jgi:hypothetical protein